MITTRRSENFGAATESVARGGTDVLTRRPLTYGNTESDCDENMAEKKARMQRNLDRLMNYDRYAEREKEELAAAQTEEEAQAITAEANFSEDDIRPTSTTMQFGDGDVSSVYNDMEKSKGAEKQGYKLNGKGKLVVVLYALAVTVILALIILNTGVLKALAAEINTLNASVAEKSATLSERQAVIDEISSDAHVIEIAENEYNMILGN